MEIYSILYLQNLFWAHFLPVCVVGFSWNFQGNDLWVWRLSSWSLCKKKLHLKYIPPNGVWLVRFKTLMECYSKSILSKNLKFGTEMRFNIMIPYENFRPSVRIILPGISKKWPKMTKKMGIIQNLQILTLLNGVEWWNFTGTTPIYRSLFLPSLKKIALCVWLWQWCIVKT